MNVEERIKAFSSRLGFWDLLLWSLLAGFGVWVWRRFPLDYPWNPEGSLSYFYFYDQDGAWRAGPLLRGLAATFKLSVYSVIIALLLGIPIGILQTSRLRCLRLLGQLYVELVRNMPPLVLMIIFYFFFASPLMEFLGIEQLSRNASPAGKAVLGFFFSAGKSGLILNNFAVGVVILGLYEASYIAEIARAGIQSIPKGQWLAADAQGFSNWDKYIFIILPQVFRNVLPAFCNQFISVIKDSSIVSLISIEELTFRGQQMITATRMFLEGSVVLFGLYFLLTWGCSVFFELLLRRQRRGL